MFFVRISHYLNLYRCCRDDSLTHLSFNIYDFIDFPSSIVSISVYYKCEFWITHASPSFRWWCWTISELAFLFSISLSLFCSFDLISNSNSVSPLYVYRFTSSLQMLMMIITTTTPDESAGCQRKTNPFDQSSSA